MTTFQSDTDILLRILRDRPKFHRGELEVEGSFDPKDSLLPNAVAHSIAADEPACYGIGDNVAQFLFEHIAADWKTLEIGLGISTLVCALKRSQHVCITPFEREFDIIRTYASEIGVSLERIEFVGQSSDVYLPNCEHANLDLVLVDGRHAFPFPILDWAYTADRLKQGGLMILDDGQMKSVRILKDFMDVDPRWEAVTAFGDKTFVFRKLSQRVHNVAWHMQPYVFEGMREHALMTPPLTRRIVNKIKRTLRLV